jgi:hypothetical protein
LVQVKGWQRSFPAGDEGTDRGDEVGHAVEGAAADGLAGDAPEEHFDRFGHDPEVGVKCMVIRGFFASQAWISARLSVWWLSTTTCSLRRG